MDALRHDKELDIATGVSRKTKKWKNKPLKWSGLLAKLEKTTRTPETVAEYKAMSRDQQSDIKDVGGFVGGYCNNGSRSDIAFRSLLCLDADFADAELWPDWQLLYGNAAAVYSTHKHTTNQPRLRLVVPLSRNVTPDEYQAIGRRVAEVLGIDKFDDTSYQPQRMMYWPSTSQDGEYLFNYIDAPLLDPDAVLATYHNWADVSSWPMSSRVAEVIKKTAAKQKDPLEKGGLVGAFCRAYTIQEAIEAYITTYVPCDEPGRYTYTEGSTAAGVVIYDDKFSYSHHATDPASSQLCNAWDLVRLHKFGVLDEDADLTKPVSSRPSYKAMAELAASDSRVKVQIVDDRTAEALDDFGEEAEPAAEGDDSWKDKLQFTEKGGLANTIGNVVLILQNDTKLAGCLAFNELNHNIVTKKSLPWRKVDSPSQWTDSDDAALRFFLESRYGISSKDRIFDAVNVAAQKASFHPVRDYLAECTWDGVARVDTLLIDYLGAEDNDYTRAVTRKALVAAVARVYRPGVKFDYMLTIRGRQGLGKSAIIAKLGGRWFSDTFTTMQGKDAYEQVQGVWLMEIGELAGMRKAEAETIKLYISKQTDRFRPAYGRRLQEFPRQCIFIGTTNEMQFLRDTTGNRRFWVVDTPNEPTKDMWSELTDDIIHQVWAEAVELYKKGESLFLGRDLEAKAREVQASYEEENPKAGIVAEYLDRLLPSGWDNMDTYARRQWLESDAVGTEKRTHVCTLEIWAEALSGNPDKLDRYASKEIRDILDNLPNWQHKGAKRRTMQPYGRQRYYERRAQ
ncbi:MAG: virulence-associated E family protein [Muribaculaceae bacterium]|nr:virulence-associated E family protein [Muribaculaceae bacterium]